MVIPNVPEDTQGIGRYPTHLRIPRAARVSKTLEGILGTGGHPRHWGIPKTTCRQPSGLGMAARRLATAEGVELSRDHNYAASLAWRRARSDT